MSKVYLYDPPYEMTAKGLVADGKAFKFYLTGRFIEECPIPLNGVTFQSVDVVSLLVYNGEVEIAIQVGEVFKKRVSDLPLTDVVKQISSLPGHIFTGTRKVEDRNSSYTQYIYVFLTGSFPDTIL